MGNADRPIVVVEGTRLEKAFAIAFGLILILGVALSWLNWILDAQRATWFVFPWPRGYVSSSYEPLPPRWMYAECLMSVALVAGGYVWARRLCKWTWRAVTWLVAGYAVVPLMAAAVLHACCYVDTGFSQGLDGALSSWAIALLVWGGAYLLAWSACGRNTDIESNPCASQRSR